MERNFRSYYFEHEDRDKGLVVVGDIDCSEDVPLVKQEFKDECDVNVIMKRYALFGAPLPGGADGLYGDFSEIGDFMDAQERVLAAKEMFASLPSVVRERFGNDPAKLIEFVHDGRNREEAQRLGLLNPPPPGANIAPPVTGTAAPPEAAPPGVAK